MSDSERIARLEKIVNELMSAHTFPREVENAIRGRISSLQTATSTKTVASETQAVNEGGAGTYNVPSLFDGFYERTLDNGTIVYTPYYL